jgi:HEAT repeat protein
LRREVEKLKRQINDSNVDVRRKAVESIRGIKQDTCIPLLLKAMEDVSWRVRKSAVEVLFDDYPMEKYIQGLIGLLYIEDNAGARNSAIEALIRLGRKATVFLIEAFQTPNRDVRKFVIDVLGEHRDPRSLPLMLEALKDEDENVRATAVEHLGKVGELSVVDALIEIIESCDLWTAYPAADALGRIGNRKAVPHLLRALRTKPLREPVLKALGRLAEPSSLSSIIPLLEDPSINIQERTLKTIAKFYHRGVDADVITREMKRTLEDRAMKLLINHAWSKKREVRISAILLLGLMKDEAAYGPLLEISQEDEFADDIKKALIFIGRDKPESLLKLFDADSPHQRRFICEVTSKIVSPVYYDILEEMLTDEDGHVRSAAAVSIAKLENPRAVDKLKKLLTDPYEDVQEAAVLALSNLSAALKTEEIIGMLRSEDSVLRRNTAYLLGNMRVSAAVEELGFALKDEDVRVRKAVVGALASIGTEEAVRYLTFALTDEDPDIRISAVLSLGVTRGEGVLDSLVILTSDKDSYVRVAAAKSLGMIGEEGAIGPLISLLDDGCGFVVATAVESLGEIGGDDARRAIAGMLSSSDEEIKRTAIMALSSFESTESYLIPFLRDPDWATRIASVKALGKKATGKVRKELEKLLDIEEDPTVLKTIEETLRV